MEEIRWNRWVCSWKKALDLCTIIIVRITFHYKQNEFEYDIN